MFATQKFLYLFFGYSLVIFPWLLTLGVLIGESAMQVNLGYIGKLIGMPYADAFLVYLIPTVLLTFFGYKLQVEGRKMK